MESPRKFNPTLIWAAITAVLVLALIVQRCNTSNNSSGSPDPLKAEVAVLKTTKSQLHDTVIYRDSIQVKHHHHYHETRRDSLIPCETKLLICDTLILADSSLIVSLRNELTIADLIIAKQDTIIRTDSTTIATLTKRVNRQKFWLRVVGITAVGCLGAAVAR